jgi:hypothetical protein
MGGKGSPGKKKGATISIAEGNRSPQTLKEGKVGVEEHP